MNRNISSITIAAAALCLMLAAGCQPKFPLCKTDEHCKGFDKHGGKVFCVNGQCQECGKDEDCGEGKVCKFNRCEAKPECLADSDCKGGLVCRSQKCVPECSADADCGTGMRCDAARCVPAIECTTDGDCREGKGCDAGRCVVKAPQDAAKKECAIDSINFEFNKYEITADAKAALEKNAECFKQKGLKSIVIEGNCDERGTTEYNMSLGLNRANAAKKYLQNLGLKDVRTTSYGKERPVCRESTEECWLKNRRDDFVTK